MDSVRQWQNVYKTKLVHIGALVTELNRRGCVMGWHLMRRVWLDVTELMHRCVSRWRMLPAV
jgi:hypothetical protein